VGVGLKSAHLPAILDGAAAGLGFFEIHAENLMSPGGPLLARVEQLREHFALSLHGVGLSIGGEDPPDAAHLLRLRRLIDRFQPRWFSEHLAWSTHGGLFFNDLLPLPYDPQTLQRVCQHIDQVQDALARPLLLENPSTYLEFEASSYTEAAFIGEVVRRTGCGLLLDVNNAHVSAVNHGRDAFAFIAALPAPAIGEIHLAGHAQDVDAAGDRLLIDTHGAPVADEVWRLYQRTLQRLGPVPTLIERDNDLPSFAALKAEALQAAAHLGRCAVGSRPERVA
jgi:uncharacterized protein (UPF0276 family)